MDNVDIKKPLGRSRALLKKIDNKIKSGAMYIFQKYLAKKTV